MHPSAPPTLNVSLELPEGWIELPAPGGRGKGLLRRDPFEALARQLVSSGAVIKPLLRPTASYLERVASADPGALKVATLVRAPSREEHTFVTFAVFGGPLVAEAPLEEMATRRGDERESEHEVEPVDLPWGRAARATYTRDRMDGGEGRPFVQYWVAPSGHDHVIIVLGDIDAPDGAPVDAYLSDIDSLVRTLTISTR
ncbi:MAG TPA: hypothetical protein VFH58_15540 [Acidimicrobiales bacterium]|nr:hypothetical protein [Acidimicrobiales bacterium]